MGTQKGCVLDNGTSPNNRQPLRDLAEKLREHASGWQQQAEQLQPQAHRLREEADQLQRQAGHLLQEAERLQRQAGHLLQEAAWLQQWAEQSPPANDDETPGPDSD